MQGAGRDDAATSRQSGRGNIFLSEGHWSHGGARRHFPARRRPIRHQFSTPSLNPTWFFFRTGFYLRPAGL